MLKSQNRWTDLSGIFKLDGEFYMLLRYYYFYMLCDKCVKLTMYMKYWLVGERVLTIKLNG